MQIPEGYKAIVRKSDGEVFILPQTEADFLLRATRDFEEYQEKSSPRSAKGRKSKETE